MHETFGGVGLFFGKQKSHSQALKVPPLPSPLGEGAQVCLLEGESLVEVGVFESGGSDLSDESNFSKEKPTYQNN